MENNIWFYFNKTFGAPSFLMANYGHYSMAAPEESPVPPPQSGCLNRFIFLSSLSTQRAAMLAAASGWVDDQCVVV